MRARFANANCSLAQALDVLGDGWTLLVLREAFVGVRRFADFERELGIAKNILTDRLAHLVEHGVMAKVDAGVHGRRYEYVLTPMGKDLTTVMTALRQWGDRWVTGPGSEPILVVDRRTGETIPQVRVLDAEGEPLRGRDMAMAPGPGADAATLARFARGSKR